nr:protein FAR-RED ELONGATED HYPOCOTYL 3 isoform X2 [Ipomoea batatas]
MLCPLTLRMYIRNKYKIPHYEFVLLGTSLLSDESSATLSWVMRTWLRTMGGEAPKAIVTDHEQAMTSVISEVFPSSLYFFCLRKVSRSVKNVVKQNEEEFMVKFEECIYKPWTNEELEESGQNLVDMFELKENELFLSLEIVADSVSKRQLRELSVVEDPMQSMNSNFFYAVDVSEDHRLKNFFWVDAKSRHDYAHFSDVVSFDATSATLSWVMRTWLRAMGGEAPKAIVTDHEQAMTSVIIEIFPSSPHFFCLGKVSESAKNVVKQNEKELMVMFEECIYRPWTNEELEEKWQNLVDMFELIENELFLSSECLVLNKYKFPHYEFVLLGTALLFDESSATLSWVMRTWLRTIGGEAPKAIVTDHEQAMTSVIIEIFPSSPHFFSLRKVSKSVKNVVKQNEEEFMVKFEECIYRPWTDEELEESGQNLVDMFELKENELFLSLECLARCSRFSEQETSELSVVEDPMQSMNSNFSYAVDVSEDHRLKNFLWVDAKSRHDYAHFSDVVSFDATSATLSWVMRTWLRTIGGEAPKAIVTDHEQAMTSVIIEIFPSSPYFFSLRKVSKSVKNVVKQNEEEFMVKFEECIYRPWTDEELEESGQNLVDIIKYKILHYEFVLLGTALLSDESSATLSWVMRTWLRTMGGEAPKAIVTDHEQAMTSVISENEEEFIVKFEECIYRPWTDEELEESGQNLVDMFELKENELFLSLECLALCSRFSEQETAA